MSWKLPSELFDQLEEIDVEGFRTFVLPGTTFPEEAPRGVRLLAHYDVYVIACHPRDHLIPEQKAAIFLRGAGPPRAPRRRSRRRRLERTQRGRRVEIRVEPFGRLTRAQSEELADDAERVARTHGGEAELIVL